MEWLRRLWGTQTSPKNRDLVWIHEAAKLKAIQRDVLDAQRGSAAALLLIAHFDDMRKQLESLLSDSLQIPTMVVLGRELRGEIAQELQMTEEHLLQLIFAERHPLIEEDERILNSFLKQLPCQVHATYHVSLQDPILKRFLNESVYQIVEQLGLTPDEAIESGMVQRRIHQIQRRISAESIGNRDASSAQEWLDLNL